MVSIPQTIVREFFQTIATPFCLQAYTIYAGLFCGQNKMYCSLDFRLLFYMNRNPIELLPKYSCRQLDRLSPAKRGNLIIRKIRYGK